MDDLPQLPPPTDPRVTAALAACRAGALSPALALLQLCMACESPQAVDAAIAGAQDEASPPLAGLAALARARPEAWTTVRRLLDTVDHGAERVETFAAAFDRAVALSPEASVALYSFGDAGLLEQATSELVRWLEDRGLLRPERSVLDLGCGIGRVAGRIGPRVRRVVGADVSERMLGEARGRWRDLPLVRTAGRDLAAFADGAFDLVLAVDSFPYLVAAGGALAGRHVAEAARVLRPGGDLVIFNLSYRGDLPADRADVRRYADAAGLTVATDGARELTIWDAPVFRLRRS